jgi:hypothetical protein
MEYFRGMKLSRKRLPDVGLVMEIIRRKIG